MIELAQDFKDILIELADAEVDFALIGGYAVAFHGYPRATKDLDLLVRANRSNAEKVYQALSAFGAPLEQFQVTKDDFSEYEGVLQIGLPPRRIDILNRVSGITFDEAVSEQQAFELDGRRIPVIGLNALLRNKRASDREQDRADIAALEPK